MKNIKNFVLASALMIAGGTLSAASFTDNSNFYLDQQEPFEERFYFGEDVETVEKANLILQKSEIAFESMMKDPENRIPTNLISKSEGIVIFPKAFKLALGAIGGQGGNGIAMIRLDDGSWSNPFFVTLGEASVGLQLGAQKSDIVLLFKNKDDVISINEADVILGTGIEVAAGPVSKSSEAVTDVNFETEIYTYQRSKGLFAGISLKGGVLSYHNTFNETLYAMENSSPEKIFNEIEAPFNNKVDYLIETLNKYGE